MALASSEFDPGPEALAGLTPAQLQAYWMPYTGNRQFKRDPRLVVAAEGCYLTSADGRRIFDSLSGLYCSGYGHSRPEITAAVTAQLGRMHFAPAFQFSHPDAFRLAGRLVELTPDGLDRVFFCNSGSEAADTSLKMARAYWRLKGQASKVKLIGRARAYHGVNCGGASVGGIGANRKMYGQMVDADHLSHTLLPENAFSRGLPGQGVELADELEELIALHDASNIAAVVMEPYSGSGGVILPPQGYLQRIRDICTRHGILLIFDEVITGFGRTGQNFGADTFGVTPDILNLAKGLTNGAVPMGAVVTGGDIYQTFMDAGGPEYMIEFPHGYTYSAHPIACAAGLAAMDIFENDRMAERCRNLAPYFEDAVHSLKGLPHVVDIRNFGLCAGIQIAAMPGEPARRPFEISMRCWDKGLYLRYGGDVVTLAPPFISEPADIDFIVNVLHDVLSAQP
ncbi:MAG: aspartate aminotransferase family protein [Gammaproteobacteria bacterium]|nr:aspartate aminotransferase family protein [Gammaproteobacteria bacterium]